MITPSRRDVVVSAAASAAVFGLDRPLAFIGSALAQESGPAQGFHRFKLGDVEVTTVYDGIWERPHDPQFIKNASVEETKAALRAAGLTDAHVPITFTVTFLKMGGRTIMFDSGTGGQLAPTAGKLAANMKAAGIDAGAIDTILVTHFHPDHIFADGQGHQCAGLPEGADLRAGGGVQMVDRPRPVRAAARGAPRARQAHPGDVPHLEEPHAGGRREEVVPGTRAVPSHGHTAGHTVYLVGSGNDQLVNLADTSNIPALFVRNPGWHAAFDADPVEAEANRRKWFDRAVADRVVVVGYHFGMPGAGRIEKDGAGYAFVPLT